MPHLQALVISDLEGEGFSPPGSSLDLSLRAVSQGTGPDWDSELDS